MNKLNLTGIVMCGGKSFRMGTDKGLIIQDGITWTALAISKLKNLTIPTFISINYTQREAYSKLFPVNELIIDNIDIPGPLAGLVTCSDQTLSNLLIIACDMTDIKPTTIQVLVDIYEQNSSSYDFIVFKNEKAAEPLLGIYTYIGLQKIKSLHLSNQLIKFSLKSILEIGNTFYIPIREDQLSEFNNYNTK